MYQRVDLLSNGSATGSGQRWDGGRGSFLVNGTFDGETVTLQVLGPDGTTYVDVGTDAALTANGVANFDLPQGMIRAAVSTGGGSPTGLYAIAVSIP